MLLLETDLPVREPSTTINWPAVWIARYTAKAVLRAAAATTGRTFLSPAARFCDARSCSVLRSAQPLDADQVHLSEEGTRLLNELLEEVVHGREIPPKP